MACLFKPAAPALNAIAADLEPLLGDGGRLTASALEELYAQIVTAASAARVREALRGPGELVSQRLFSIAGGIEKHLGSPAILDVDDVWLLHAAIRDCAEMLEAMAEASVRGDAVWEMARFGFEEDA